MAVPFITVILYITRVALGISFVSNLLVLVVLARTKSLQVRFYGFVVNLAIADIVFAVFLAAYTLTRQTIYAELGGVGYVVSVLTILAVAVNRYLALSLGASRRYDALLTPARLVAVCLGIWCVTLLVYALPVFVTSDETSATFKYLVRPLAMIVIWVITVVLYWLAFRQIKRYTPPLAQSQGISPSDETAETRAKQTRRLLITFVFVLAGSFVCWIPYCVVVMVRHFYPDLLRQNASFYTFHYVSLCLYTITPMINPLVYWFRLKEFRDGFYALFCRCCVKRYRSEPENPVEMEQTVEVSIAERVM